jgi:hypothetical protein
MFSAAYHPHECHLLPSLCIAAGVCEDPRCRTIHGYEISFQWAFWSVSVMWRV